MKIIIKRGSPVLKEGMPWNYGSQDDAEKKIELLT